MTALKLHVFDKAFAVNAAEEAEIMRAASDLLGWQTLDEWIAEQRQFERELIGGGFNQALSALCQGACEKVGVLPSSKTFVIVS